MLLEAVLMDLDFQVAIKFRKKAFPSSSDSADDDGVFILQVFYIPEGGPEHGVGGYEAPSELFLIVIGQSAFDRSNVSDDALLGQVGKYLIK
jgi:hypothetical protein